MFYRNYNTPCGDSCLNFTVITVINDQIWTKNLSRNGHWLHARQRGICSALVSQAIDDVKAQGFKIVVTQLMAKNMAGGIAENLEAKTIGYFTPYVYGADAAIEP